MSLFIFQDSYVVSFLVAGIMVIVLLLLMYNFKSPKSVVMDEVGGSEHIEGALRRVLGEKKWAGAATAGSVDTLKLQNLENEVLEKDQEIANLHKQLTQSPTTSGGSGGEELQSRIDDLEARLQEYEIIEDDIADLSLYKTENENLKSELEKLKEMKVESVKPEPVVQASVESEAVSSEAWENSESEQGDLVAEFEKVVSSQEAMEEGTVPTGEVTAQAAEDIGEVDLMGVSAVAEEVAKEVEPDSKEEAEMFISDLKSLKKGS